jgi:hypothetical protein
MIFLFDNCYLSTTNTIVEDHKQVWIGTHTFDNDINLDYTYDIISRHDTITTTELDTLFEQIHADYNNEKVVIYTDNEYFTYVYYFFFRGFLPKTAVDQMFAFDVTKENFGLGNSIYGLFVTGNRTVIKTELTLDQPKPKTFSKFSPTVTQHRLELAFANALLGDTVAMEYCVDRATQMWDGTPGFRAKYAEQTLPALLTDAQYTIENLSDPEFIEQFIDSFEVDEFLPNKVLTKVKEVFDFDYLNHFFNVVNDNGFSESEYIDMWSDAASLTKRELIKQYLINPHVPAKLELLFPSISNFDSLNPIFWNEVFRHYNNTSWLSKYGINNQTNGTV